MESSEATGMVSRRRAALATILLVTLLTRCVRLDQPIVENFVGRQVPTAMVARNLDRGSGFLRPSLDVAPFPNLFLVEPPLYAAAAVALRRASWLTLEAAGRLVSALGIALGAWGLHGLVCRRSGPRAGLLAALLFGAWPIAIRYGRAFQPDALMLGGIVAGLSCWDRARRGGVAAWAAAGFVLVAAGLALKVLSAYVLVPLLCVLIPPARPRRFVLAGATLLPALLWYVYAAGHLAAVEGSRASADNGAIWLRALDPSAMASRETLGHVARFLGVRGFTPIGVPLAIAGLWVMRSGRRLWLLWGGAALAAMAAVAPKLHHEYYWLCLAPVVSAGAAEALDRLAGKGRGGGLAAGLALATVLVLCAGLSASTWRTPPEWASIGRAGRVVAAIVPPSEWVAAPESLLYVADRRGCRLEFTPEAARRAAGEWGRAADEAPPVAAPVDLLAFYGHVGARYVADVVPEAPTAARLALHGAIRARYNVIWDRDGILVAELRGTRDGAGTPHDRQGR